MNDADSAAELARHLYSGLGQWTHETTYPTTLRLQIIQPPIQKLSRRHPILGSITMFNGDTKFVLQQRPFFVER